MPPFAKHIFVCTNRRSPGHPKGCCADRDSERVLSRFKELIHKAGLKGIVRANSSGCMDACSDGPTVVVYPENVWYGHVTVDDVDEIVGRHVLAGEPVERLRLSGERDEESGGVAHDPVDQ